MDDIETMPNFAQTCNNLKYWFFCWKLFRDLGGGNAKSELGDAFLIYKGKKKWGKPWPSCNKLLILRTQHGETYQ